MNQKNTLWPCTLKNMQNSVPATPGVGGAMRSKKRKRKKRKKRKSFKVETIKRLSTRSKCYCFSHSSASTTMVIILWEFLMFYQIFISPQVKRSLVISNKLAYKSCLTSCQTTKDLRLAKHSLKVEIELTFPAVRHFTWKLEFSSNVLSVLVEFKIFSCRPTMVADNTFQCSVAPPLWNAFRRPWN